MCSNCSGDYEDPDMTQEIEQLEAIDHETTLQELAQAAVLDGILDASRKVRAGDDMLFAALRKAGVL